MLNRPARTNLLPVTHTICLKLSILGLFVGWRAGFPILYAGLLELQYCQGLITLRRH